MCSSPEIVPFTVLQGSPATFKPSFHPSTTSIPFITGDADRHTARTAALGGKCCFSQCSQSLLTLAMNYIKASCPRQGDSHILIFKSSEHSTFKLHTWTEWRPMLCISLTRAWYWAMDPGILCLTLGIEEWDPAELLYALDYRQYLLQTDQTSGGEKSKPALYILPMLHVCVCSTWKHTGQGTRLENWTSLDMWVGENTFILNNRKKKIVWILVIKKEKKKKANCCPRRDFLSGE